MGGLARLWKSTIRVTPALLAAATIASASSTVVASGFSTRMCLPASAQATATARWAWSGVATETAVIAGSARMLVELGRVPARAVCLGEALRARFVQIADGGEVHHRVTAVGLGVPFAEQPGADERETCGHWQVILRGASVA